MPVAAATRDENGQPDEDEDREDEEPLEAEHFVDKIVEIVHGEAFTDRKSTFQAHLAKVSSEEQVCDTSSCTLVHLCWRAHKQPQSGRKCRRNG